MCFCVISFFFLFSVVTTSTIACLERLQCELCTGAMAHCFLNLGWFSVFDFIKNMKYACDRKFTEVYMCQKLSKK